MGPKSRAKEGLAPDRVELLTRRTWHLLLDPAVPELARQIVDRRDARGLPDPVDLETIDPADSCKDGDCAID